MKNHDSPTPDWDSKRYFLPQILFFALSLIILWGTLSASPPFETTQHSTYYHQRSSLFKSLPNSKGEIVFLGDSITDGCEWSEFHGGREIKNRGISGDTTDGVLERLGEVTESRPEKIFLMIGVNDLARGESIDYILNNIARIIRKVLRNSQETALYVQSILPVNPQFDQFPDHTDKGAEILEINRKLRVFCTRQGVFYIDLHSAFLDENKNLSSLYSNDGLHLTGEGYVLWWSLIEKFVKDPSRPLFPICR
ncbi:GDSL-type esterase/lipase family protein [Acidobacteriota bacterium]